MPYYSRKTGHNPVWINWLTMTYNFVTWWLCLTAQQEMLLRSSTLLFIGINCNFSSYQQPWVGRPEQTSIRSLPFQSPSHHVAATHGIANETHVRWLAISRRGRGRRRRRGLPSWMTHMTFCHHRHSSFSFRIAALHRSQESTWSVKGLRLLSSLEAWAGGRTHVKLVHATTSPLS